MKKIDTIKRKIIYRAEYRGIKEMDILLSSFVKKYIDTFNYTELVQLYEILKIDDDNFRLCDAGIAGTITSNFDKKNYVSISGSGSGYQYFKYPDIVSNLNFIASGIGSTSVTVTPIVRGSIVGSYLYEKGTGYGSTILNHEKTPTISIKNGSNGSLLPNISNGSLKSVMVEYGGKDYYSIPDLNVVDPTGKGSGAKLRAVVENQKIAEVKVINPGIGYSSTSTIEVKSSGTGALFGSKIREF